MRLLIAFAAILGYAAAGYYSPLAYAVNPGDAQAAAIDATVAAQDHARAFGESQARAGEAALQYNIESTRQVAEAHRDLNENAYWNGVAATQNAVAAAQSHAAAYSGAAAAVQGAHYAAPIVAPYNLASPYAYGGYGLGLHGVHAW